MSADLGLPTRNYEIFIKLYAFLFYIFVIRLVNGMYVYIHSYGQVDTKFRNKTHNREPQQVLLQLPVAVVVM